MNASLDPNCLVQCHHCHWFGSASQVLDITDFMQRVKAGHKQPGGMCPKCGALACVEKRPDADPAGLYRVCSEDNALCLIVGTKSHKHAAQIAAEVIAENDPPGTGAVCCVERLCPQAVGRRGTTPP
jgi:hypothetical protein